jgi:glycerol uptake facilitator-like aquaporin
LTRRYLIEGSRVARVLVFALAPRVRKNPKSEEEPIALNDSRIILQLTGFAGIPIGLVLTLIHLVSIPVTNTSVNPARSIGPALFVGGWALQQLWLFVVAPLAGSLLAAAVYNGFTVPSLTAREAERALPTEQEERLKRKAATS